MQEETKRIEQVNKNRKEKRKRRKEKRRRSRRGQLLTRLSDCNTCPSATDVRVNPITRNVDNQQDGKAVRFTIGSITAKSSRKCVKMRRYLSAVEFSMGIGQMTSITSFAIISAVRFYVNVLILLWCNIVYSSVRGTQRKQQQQQQLYNLLYFDIEKEYKDFS